MKIYNSSLLIEYYEAIATQLKIVLVKLVVSEVVASDSFTLPWIFLAGDIVCW